MKPIHVPLELLRKYNVPGPRYTSYPPATHFTEAFCADSGPETESRPAPLSLYFHLPFCVKQCLYCGCTNIITNDQTKSAKYLGYLEREMTLRSPQMGHDSKTIQIQLGGGTPTFLRPEEIEQLGKLIHANFQIGNEVEAGVEIDPRSLTLEKTEALRRAGFNRASLGIQDTNPEVQQIIGRIQPSERIIETLGWLRDAGFGSINFDLIYGLPKQTPASFRQTLDDVLAFAPDRFAIYSYAHIPWIKPQQKSFEAHMPNTDTKLELLQTAIETLTAAGYIYIGMDHFAKPDDALAQALTDGTLQRNFQGYSTHRGVDLHGFGMSAISHAHHRYFQNYKTLESYYGALDKNQLPWLRGYAMTPEDRIRYTTIMQIMCNLHIRYSTLSQEIGGDATEYFRDEINSLDDLEADGLVRRESDGLQITPLGRLFVRIVAMRFDAYRPAEQKTNRYSRIV